jgi:hypothetical protein
MAVLSILLIDDDNVVDLMDPSVTILPPPHHHKEQVIGAGQNLKPVHVQGHNYGCHR